MSPSNKLVGTLSGALAVFLMSVAAMVPASYESQVTNMDVVGPSVDEPLNEEDARDVLCSDGVTQMLEVSPVEVDDTGMVTSVAVGPFPQECAGAIISVGFLDIDGQVIGEASGAVNAEYSIVDTESPLDATQPASVEVMFVED